MSDRFPNLSAVSTVCLEMEMARRKESERKAKEEWERENSVMIVCPWCHGKGSVRLIEGVLDQGDVKCSTCGGTGKIKGIKV